MNRTETFQHGYPIVYALPHDGGRMIVADRGEHVPHRYAVWREDEGGFTHGGNYVHTLQEAKGIASARNIMQGRA